MANNKRSEQKTVQTIVTITESRKEETCIYKRKYIKSKQKSDLFDKIYIKNGLLPKQTSIYEQIDRDSEIKMSNFV